mgnify:CR=1 FL=1
MLNFKSLALKITALFFLATTFQSANAAEINMPGLSGSLTSTLTSGFSMRVAEIDCNLLDGYNTDAHKNAGTTALRTLRGEDATLDYIVGGSARGCAKARTDTYGNTTNQAIDLGNANSNNDSLNYEAGDIFSASQSVYSSFTGMTDGGLNVDFSFTASVDPALDISPPAWEEFTDEAKGAFENDATLLDFYISGSEDVGNSYIDFSLGKSVTSWGESTFIPIGMNGLVTNPLDLSKLTSPSAGIKEALIPVENITLATGLADGSNLEAYYQFKHRMVGIPASGSYFGSETFGPGAESLIATGTGLYERENPDACPGLLVTSGATANASGTTYASLGFAHGAGRDCTAANIANFSHNKTSNTYQAFNTLDLALAGLKQMTATEVGASIGAGKAHVFVTDRDGSSTEDANSAGVIAANSGTATDIGKLLVSIAALDDFTYDSRGTVDVRISSRDGLFAEPRDDGQFGLKWSKYFDGVGTGLDFSVSYANYHSKVPYIQFSMPGALFASDALGAYLTAAADFQGLTGVPGDGAGTFELNGTENVYKALTNAAMSSGICTAVTKGNLATALGYADATTEQKEAAYTAAYYKEINEGQIVHDSSQCMKWGLGDASDALDASITSLPDAAGSAAAQLGGNYTTTYNATVTSVGTALVGTGARLFAAVTPMAFIDYTGIFPEDLQVLSLSGSTNFGGTTFQAEMAYRPNFPLATGAGNQINQLNDKNGANDALNMVAVAGGYATADGLAGFNALIDAVCQGATQASCGAAGNATANSAFFYGGLGAYERSDLGDVWDANGNSTTDLTSRYYSKPYIKYDVITGTLGTTTSFQASHPVTVGLGADSSVFLSEIGFVRVNNMNDSVNGHVARGGWNEGVAAGTEKCLGAFGTSKAVVSTAAAAISNIGSGVVDALFGNGGYCENKPGADDFALTYRLIGSATYNNINNSQWSFSPNFAWSHDPHGYAPSSMGGFVEGRQSLSLGANFSKNDLRISTSYVDYMGDELSQLSADKDYLSLAVSYAF